MTISQKGSFSSKAPFSASNLVFGCIEGLASENIQGPNSRGGESFFVGIFRYLSAGLVVKISMEGIFHKNITPECWYLRLVVYTWMMDPMTSGSFDQSNSGEAFT